MYHRLCLIICVALGGPLSAAAPVFAQKPAKPATGKPAAGWTDLFDGKSLNGWKITDFPGRAEPKVEDGKLILPFGSDMTGVTCAHKEIPKDNYEIELLAQRVDGNDFFCGLTFPVGKEPCTLICGGWGGGIVGLSSIDGQNASENATTSYQNFERGKWYKIRLRVAGGRIDAWIDDKQVVDFEVGDHQLSIRWECEPCQPLGIATWCTTGAVKSVRLRNIPEDEVKKIVAEAKAIAEKRGY